ncbi:hypothetical protein Trydic_g2726 [Trypoxylus dichotomus]
MLGQASLFVVAIVVAVTLHEVRVGEALMNGPTTFFARTVGKWHQFVNFRLVAVFWKLRHRITNPNAFEAERHRVFMYSANDKYTEDVLITASPIT